MRKYRSRDIVQAFQWHSGNRATKLAETLLVTPGHFTEPDLRGCGVVRNPHSIGDGAIVHNEDWVCVRSLAWPEGTTSRIVTVMDKASFKAGFEPIDQAVLEEARIEQVDKVIRHAWGGRMLFSPHTIRRIIEAALTAEVPYVDR